MLKKLSLLSLFCVFSLFNKVNAQDITGFWRSINEKTGKTQCIVAIYKYQNKYYGRIIATFNKNGSLADSIYAPKQRAPGIVGQPYYCGLDLIWGLKDDGSRRYRGRIVDPEKGNIYKAKVWIEEGNLIVRGELLCFGRSVVWLPAQDSDFSAEFQKPDVSQFVPSVPKVG